MTNEETRLSASFFQRDAVTVARELLGKTLVRAFSAGEVKRYRITETEAYCGPDDLACHASKGRTKRTEVMFKSGGHIYVYLIYGMYWMLNFVSGAENEAAAVLIRGLEGFGGPGKLGRELRLDGSFYGEALEGSVRLWVEDGPQVMDINATPRVGIAYAGEPWVSKEWRFTEKT